MPAIPVIDLGFDSGLPQTVFGVVMIGIVLALNSAVIVRVILFSRHLCKIALSLPN